ncbi:MAG: hypothetical protein JJU15_00355 [Pararhodobacter sp.]|nr:hypothetical protein [Pararhodobacter sp.]
MRHDRKLTSALAEHAELTTARRHQMRADLCLSGLDWHTANAESWRAAKMAQFRSGTRMAAEALFIGEAA